MIEPGRKFVQGAKKYRYGFNGQEHSAELNDNSYTAEYWEYDARIGRRWNVEPLIGKYPSLSSYATLGNNPINATDPDGQDVILLIWATKGKDAGHTAIAIRDYKTERVKVKGQWKTVHKALDTYTLYELGPATLDISDNEKHAATTDRVSNYGHGVDRLKKYTKEQIIANKGENGKQISSYDKFQADGIISFGKGTDADYNADIKAYNALEESEDTGHPTGAYNGVTNNCTDYVLGAVPTSEGEKINGKESILVPGKGNLKVATPNKLYQEAEKLKKAIILKKAAAELIKKTFLEAFLSQPDPAKKSGGSSKN